MKGKKKRIATWIAMLSVLMILLQPAMSFATAMDSLAEQGGSKTVVTEEAPSSEETAKEETEAEESKDEGEADGNVQDAGKDPSEEKAQDASKELETDQEKQDAAEEEEEDESLLKEATIGILSLMRGSSYGNVNKLDSYTIPGCSAKCGKFNLDTKSYGKKVLAFCGNHSRYSPSDGASITDITAMSREKHSTLYKALYYGYGGPAEKVSHDKTGWIKTSMAVSLANGDVGCDISSYDSFYSKVKKYSMPPASFKVYRAQFAGRNQDLFFWTYQPKGELKVEKVSADKYTVSSNGYSLKGAKYGVYKSKSDANKDKDRVTTLTTLSGGTSEKVKLEAGTYYVKEVTASKGFGLDKTVYTVKIKEGKVSTVDSKEPAKKGKIKIKKVSASPEITDGNSKYNLAGAEYTVYRTRNGDTLSDKVGVLKTNSKGESGTLTVVADTYYVKETKAPAAGYYKDEDIHEVDVTEKHIKDDITVVEPVSLTVEEQAKTDPVSILLYKVNEDGEMSDAVSKDSLKGAKFQFDFYAGEHFTKVQDANGKKATKTWIFQTDEDGVVELSTDPKYFVSGDSFDYSKDGKLALAEGSLIAREIEAPEGYQIAKDPILCKVRADGSYGAELGNKLVVPTVEEPFIYGDIELRKTDESGSPLEGVTFDIVSKETGAVVKTITTDKDGYATTKDKEKPEGSIPYGTYIIKEVKCPDNYVPAKDQEVKIEESGKVVPLTFVNKKAKIGTTAKDAASGTNKTYASGRTVIIDTVAYENLRANEDYIVKGYLVDAETGEKIQNDEGKDICSSADFTPEASNGTIDVTFTFDSNDLKGKTVVVFEELYLDKEEAVLVAEHKDPKDQDQSILFVEPKISTKAMAEDTKKQVTKADGTKNIIDTISYENLIPGVEHIIKGQLVDADTNEALYVDSGNGKKPVTTEVKFTPETEKGTVESTFTIDTKDLSGKKIVIFETLYAFGDDDNEVASHCDITDVNQMICFPKIGTTALDSETKEHISYADGKATIIDTVSYENLFVGSEYTVKGTLMDKATSKPLLDANGKEITAETTFVAVKPSGTIDVKFEFDASKFGNITAVAFEELYIGSDLLTEHKDIDDEEQTVFFPELQTSLTNAVNGNQISFAGDDVELVDVVSYKNLIAGKEYTVKGILMDKSTSKPLLDADGKEVTAEAKFTAEAAEGNVEVRFKFDATGLDGKTAVAFEELYLDEKIVAAHEDIEDEAQSVVIPKIGTTALDSDTKEHISYADGEVTIIDTVAYENLVVGKEYVVNGYLVSQKTGFPLKADGEKITATATFVAEKASGSVDIKFTFDASELEGKTVVAYEELTMDGEIIAEHKDKDDGSQTIHFPKVKTSASEKSTGDRKVVSKDGKTVTIVDEVEYKNLVPGKTYRVRGILMDKATGEPVPAQKEGAEGIIAETEFVAKEADGTVEVVFTVDISKLGGRELVVFEDLYIVGDDGTESIIGTHKDINDRHQTIKILADTPKTGDLFSPFLLIPIIILAGSVTMGVIFLRKREEY